MSSRRKFLAQSFGAVVAFPLLMALLAGCEELYDDTDPPVDRWSTQGYGANVTISKPILLDQNVTASTVTVTSAGLLLFDPDASRTITLTGNFINRGWLEMRPASPSVKHRIVFSNVNEGAFVGGGLNPIGSDVGFWDMDAGIVNLRGTPKTAWVRAFGSIAQGATQCGLNAAPEGWRVGDEIVIPSTTRDPHAQDIRTLTEITGTTIKWSGGTTYAHPISPWLNKEQTIRLGAEIANLTRNVQIGGTAGHRSHTFFRSTQPQSIFDVELRHMGPQQAGSSVLGRYPLHFHHAMNGSAGTKVQGVVVRDSGGHAFVPHMSDDIWFQDVVAQDILGQALWWDHPANDKGLGGTGISNGITYSHCFVNHVGEEGTSRYKSTGVEQNLGSNDHMQNCVVIGVYGPDSAGIRWDADEEAVWDHNNNLVHSCEGWGLVIWQNDDLDHIVDRDRIYHCGGGISNGAYANGYRYVDCAIVNCGDSADALSVDANPGLHKQAWTRLYVDVTGVGGPCIDVFDASVVAAAGRIQFYDCTLRGATGSFIRVAEREDGDPDRFISGADFHGTTFIGTAPQLSYGPGADPRCTVTIGA